MATLPPLASPEDLEARLMRTFSADELARVEQVLAEVSAAVRFETGKDWMSAAVPPQVDAPDLVVQLTLRVADRAMRNPEGFSSESAGDYSYQRNGATGEGGVYFTERELRVLRRLGGKTGLWTQATTRNENWADTVWVDGFGSEPFPIDVSYPYP